MAVDVLAAMVVVVAKAVVGGEGGSRWSRSWLMCSTPTGDRMNEIGKIVVVHSDKCKWLKHSASREYFLIVAAAGGLIL